MLNKGIGTVERNTVSPQSVTGRICALLPTRTNVVVRNRGVAAGRCSIARTNDVQTAPASGVLGSYMVDDLARGEASNLDVGAATNLGTCIGPVTIDLDVPDLDAVVPSRDQYAGCVSWSDLNSGTGAVSWITLSRDLLVISGEINGIGDLDGDTWTQLDDSSLTTSREGVVDGILAS